MVIERLNHGCTTLLEAINVVEKEGYIIQFTLINNKLMSEIDNAEFHQKEIASISFLRINAPLSEHDEESILYLITLKNGVKGWISDSYSIYADAALSDFLQDFEKYSSDKK